jgi:riboflavin biosynthesis pyrimidine reductase
MDLRRRREGSAGGHADTRRPGATAKVCHAGALLPPGPHRSLLRCPGRRRHRAGGGRIDRPQPPGRRPGFRAPARRRARGRGRPDGRRSARTQPRLLQPHAAQAPWVRLKVAASLDGRTALDNGASQWITSAPARADGHAWRARAGAILTGIGTVRDDNPRLDVRLATAPAAAPGGGGQPPRDTAGRAAVPAAAPGLDLWRRPDAERVAEALEGRGATCDTCQRPGPAHPAKVDLRPCWPIWRGKEVNELHVEAGHRLNGPCCVRAWWTNCCCTWPPSSSARAATWQRSGRWTWTKPCRCLFPLQHDGRARPASARASGRRSGFSFHCAGFAGPISAKIRHVHRNHHRRRAHRRRRRPRQLLDPRQAPDHRGCPPGYLDDVGLGDSIALNGACMTVTRFDPAARSASTSLPNRWTRRRASARARAGQPGKGAARARPAGRPHRVRPCGRRRQRRSFEQVGESWELLCCSPAALARYLAYKGSITVNGVSLTVNRVTDLPRLRNQHQPDPPHDREHRARPAVVPAPRQPRDRPDRPLCRTHARRLELPATDKDPGMSAAPRTPSPISPWKTSLPTCAPGAW